MLTYSLTCTRSRKGNFLSCNTFTVRDDCSYTLPELMSLQIMIKPSSPPPFTIWSIRALAGFVNTEHKGFHYCMYTNEHLFDCKR